MIQPTIPTPMAPDVKREPTVAPRSEKLPGLPNRPLSPQEQLLALRRVQAQAEQRLKLGSQFFQAAKAQVVEHASLLTQLREEQARLREQMREEYARSIREYEQYRHHRDEDVTVRLDQLERRLEDLQSHWSSVENKVAALLQRAQTMLDDNQSMLHLAPRLAETTMRSVGLTESQEQIHLAGATVTLHHSCGQGDWPTNLLPQMLNLTIDSGTNLTWNSPNDEAASRMVDVHQPRECAAELAAKEQLAPEIAAPTEPLIYSSLGQLPSTGNGNKVDEPPLSPSLFSDIVAKLRKRQDNSLA